MICSSLLVLLAGCGGGGGGDSPAPTPSPAPVPTPAPPPITKVGVFIDSPVQGLEVWIDGVKAGLTDAQGQFNYPEGKTVTFRIGALTLGTSSAPSVVTPADLSTDPVSVQNILVALQSLDSDRNPANGITIAADTAAKLVSAADLSMPGSNLSSLSKDLPALSLVAKDAALTHFWSQAASLKPNPLVLSALDQMVGFWQMPCDGKGRIAVWDIQKVSANRWQFARSISREHTDANCTSTSYAERTDTHNSQSDFATVMGASRTADGTLTLQGLALNSKNAPGTFTATVAPDGSSVAGIDPDALPFSLKRLSSFAVPGGAAPAPAPRPAIGTLSVNGGDSYPLRVSFSLDSTGLINGGGYDFHKIKGTMSTLCTYGSANAENCVGASNRITLSSQHGKFSAQGAATPAVLIAGPDATGYTFSGTLTGLSWTGTWIKAATASSSSTGAGSFAVPVVFGDGQVPGQAPGSSWSGPPTDNPAALRVWLALDAGGKVDVKSNRSRYSTHFDKTTNSVCTPSEANKLSCNGRSDVFLVALAGAPFSASGAATPTALQLIDGNGSVWTGTVTGKTWAGLWSSAPGVLPALSVKFSVELQFE
ncbi:MAG: hypothetical protein C0423_06315 [Methylibium sp.]|nr:hypothetical protein [Methylibium sp.]